MKDKVIVYCVEDDRLLVFRHTDFSFEEVGIQVPAGTIREGETSKEAALRELQEETGHTRFNIIRDLGTSMYHMGPYRDEIQCRHFFLARPTERLPERWGSQEKHDGKEPPTNFECFWIPIEHGHILQAGQGAMLHKVIL